MLKEARGGEGTIAQMEKSGALLSGHFALSSGLHSDRYIQCALLLESPATAEAVGRALAGLVEEAVGCGTIGAVVSPALGGIIIGYEVARTLGARSVFAERSAGALALRRGFRLKPYERVLVVEDVVTTGLSTKEVIEVVKPEGADPIAVASIVDRSAESDGVDFGIPFVYLVRAAIPSYEPAECPLCKKGVPIVKPGSRSQGQSA
jgi:orotate phosphoribosyltransferase